jgi:ADP-ribose pyrophosphatase YjhB (NUDIX family)
MSQTEPKWLSWARELQAIAQNGLAFSKNPYDIERFKAVRGVAEEILAQYTGADLPSLAGLFNREEGYATPKVDVRGGIIQENRILLVRELADGGRWTLPGGYADVGDTPSEAVTREIREEAGYLSRATRLVAVYDRSRRGHPPVYFSAYKLFFLCEITGGEPHDSIETGGVGFFAEDQLPELSLARVTSEEIHTLFEHYRQPDLPAEFD